MDRRTLALLLAAAVSLTAPAAAAAPPEHSAASAVLMDAGSGRVLYACRAHEPRPIASITKLLTALVAVESHPDLSEVVTVEAEWLAGAEGSSIYLAPGDRLTLETLLYGLLLESGNDAAQVVAGYCAGDVDTFVAWMNLRAADLGMENSHFTNPSGLSADGHYSTAYDMALAAAACLQNEAVAAMAATRSITLEGRTFTNHNKLLSRYEGCVGMKTGYTQLAGRTLVSCARRAGQTLIAVTLNDPNDWEDHAALLDYGFAAWPEAELAAAGEELTRLPVEGSLVPFVGVAALDALTYPLGEGEEAQLRLELPGRVTAPVAAGAIAGSLSAWLEGEEIGRTYLVYTADVHTDFFRERPLWQRFLEFFGGGAGEKPRFSAALGWAGGVPPAVGR